MEKVKELAREALAHFEARGSGKSFYILGDNAPFWVRQLVLYAHDELFPDDWRYKFIVQSLSSLESGDYDGSELAPSHYTCELTDWLASPTSRLAYCDAAREEYGLQCNLFGLLQAGQMYELREVFSLVKSYLEERALDNEHAAVLGEFYGTSLAEEADD